MRHATCGLHVIDLSAVMLRTLTHLVLLSFLSLLLLVLLLHIDAEINSDSNLFQSKHVIQRTATWSICSPYVQYMSREHFTDYITVTFHFTIFSYRLHFHRSFVFCPFLLFLYAACDTASSLCVRYNFTPTTNSMTLGVVVVFLLSEQTVFFLFI